MLRRGRPISNSFGAKAHANVLKGTFSTDCKSNCIRTGLTMRYGRTLFAFEVGILLYLSPQRVTGYSIHKSSIMTQHSYSTRQMLRISFFLARLEFLCKIGCVPHYFQYKEVTFLFPPPKSESQILNYQILNICRVL